MKFFKYLNKDFFIYKKYLFYNYINLSIGRGDVPRAEVLLLQHHRGEDPRQ